MPPKFPSSSSPRYTKIVDSPKKTTAGTVEKQAKPKGSNVFTQTLGIQKKEKPHPSKKGDFSGPIEEINLLGQVGDDLTSSMVLRQNPKHKKETTSETAAKELKSKSNFLSRVLGRQKKDKKSDVSEKSRRSLSSSDSDDDYSQQDFPELPGMFKKDEYETPSPSSRKRFPRRTMKMSAAI